MIRVAARVALLALALTALAAPAAAAPGAPKILQLEYYEDTEDGYRYNVVATVKRRADRVTARSGSVRTAGRLSGHIGTTGPGRLWFFRERAFIRKVRSDLLESGTASVVVKAVGDRGTTRKRCRLNFQPDPQYGDYASGDCRRT